MGKKVKEVVESDSEAEEVPEPVEAKKANKGSAFSAALMDSDDDDDSSEERAKEAEEKKKKEKEKKKKKDDEEMDFGDKKKKKKEDKEDDTNGKEDKKDKKEKKEKKEKKDKKPAPIICEVQSIKAVPKKDNLKVCDVIVGPGATVQIVTNATNITAGSKCIVALAGVTLATGKEVSEG